MDPNNQSSSVESGKGRRRVVRYITGAGNIFRGRNRVEIGQDNRPQWIIENTLSRFTPKSRTEEARKLMYDIYKEQGFSDFSADFHTKSMSDADLNRKILYMDLGDERRKFEKRARDRDNKNEGAFRDEQIKAKEEADKFKQLMDERNEINRPNEEAMRENNQRRLQEAQRAYEEAQRAYEDQVTENIEDIYETNE